MKVAGDTPSPWCHNEPPLAYSYIQKVILICLSLFSFTLHWSQVHWDNGFLAYWDTKQLPNFLLAVPCVLMVLHHSWEFVQVGKSDAQVSSTHCQHVGALGLCKEVRFGGQQLAWDAKKALPGR